MRLVIGSVHRVIFAWQIQTCRSRRSLLQLAAANTDAWACTVPQGVHQQQGTHGPQVMEAPRPRTATPPPAPPPTPTAHHHYKPSPATAASKKCKYGRATPNHNHIIKCLPPLPQMRSGLLCPHLPSPSGFYGVRGCHLCM